MRRSAIFVAACLAAVVPFAVARAADELNPLDRLAIEVGRQGELIRQQQKAIAALTEAQARQPLPATDQPRQAGAQATGLFGGSSLTNPNLSMVLDTFSQASNRTNDELETRGIPGFTTAGLEQRRGFNPRAAELFIFAPVDPYFNLYTTFPITEDGVELEEAFVVTTSLPAGLQIKGGKFKSAFSRLNAQHPHAWDFYDIALPYRAFLGDEGLGGEKGMQITWLPAWPVYTQFGAEVLQGENDLLFGSAASSSPHAFAFFIKSSVEATDHSTLYFGPSGLFGQTRNSGVVADLELAGDSALYGLEGVWKWRPTNSQGFVLQAEYLFLDQTGDLTDAVAETVETLSRQQDGFYVQGIYRAGRWRFGARYDRLALFADRFKRAEVEQELGEAPWRLTGAVEFNPSEFSRIRLQYNHDRSGRDGLINDEAILQFQFGIGAHAGHSF